MIHTVIFGIVNKAEVDDFLELSCFLDDLKDVGNLISGSSVFSKTSLNIWKFMVYVFHAKIGTIKNRNLMDLTEAEDVFLEFPCFFYDPAYVGNLISGSSVFFKSSLYIWKFSVHILLKPSLMNAEHYLVSM